MNQALLKPPTELPQPLGYAIIGGDYLSVALAESVATVLETLV